MVLKISLKKLFLVYGRDIFWRILLLVYWIWFSNVGLINGVLFFLVVKVIGCCLSGLVFGF